MEMKTEMDQLAEHCLQLEKQIQQYEEHIKGRFGAPYTTVALFYDAGRGLCEADKEQVPFVGLTQNRVKASFCLPEDAVQLRLDPGEESCYICNLEIKTPGIQAECANGIEFRPGHYLFLQRDPNFYLVGQSRFPQGMKIDLSYDYYSCETKEKDALWALRTCLLQREAETAGAGTGNGLLRKLARRLRRR